MLDEDSITTDKQDSKPAPVKLTNKKRKAPLKVIKHS